MEGGREGIKGEFSYLRAKCKTKSSSRTNADKNVSSKQTYTHNIKKGEPARRRLRIEENGKKHNPPW